MDSKKKNGNPEIDDIGTHMAGATDLHKTRHADKPIQFDPPVTPGTGPYDMRTGAFDPETEDSPTEQE